MARKPMSAASLATAQRITPSGYGEEVYQAKLAAKMVRGPSGLMIPAARATYRNTLDGPLLVNLARRAYADWKAAQLTPAAKDGARRALAADLETRYPAADMAVLQRYGAGEQRETVIVIMDERQFEKPVWLTLPAPMWLPTDGFRFRTNEEGQRAAVPAETRPFFDLVRTVRAAEQADFMKVIGWPSQFKLQHKRAPTWREIEQAWPRIGEWLDQQRSAAA